MVRAMRYIKVIVFEHQEITSDINIDKRINYTQLILRGMSLKEYKEVLVGCKE